MSLYVILLLLDTHQSQRTDAPRRLRASRALSGAAGAGGGGVLPAMGTGPGRARAPLCQRRDAGTARLHLPLGAPRGGTLGACTHLIACTACVPNARADSPHLNACAYSGEFRAARGGREPLRLRGPLIKS